MMGTRDTDTKLALFLGEPTTAPSRAAFRRVAFRVDGTGFVEFLKRLGDLGLERQGGNG